MKKLASLLTAALMNQPLSAQMSDGLSVFEEAAEVITASRRVQAIQESPSAIDVITQEEIRASKAANLSDLLRFRVGLDVLEQRSTDSNRTIISVRGFPAEFVGSLQVLVDGRSVYQSSGGVFWQKVPVQIQDIDRIEIVRGPNAALYGSNSGFGVINIITKKPGNGALALGGLFGNNGTVGATSAVEKTGGRAGVRASYTYHSHNGLVTATGGKVDDALDSRKINVRSSWQLTDRASLEFFAGQSDDSSASGGTRAGLSEVDFRDQFGMLKYQGTYAGGASLEVMGAVRNSRLAGQTREAQSDAEAIYRLPWANGAMNTAGGASYRHVESDSSVSFRREHEQRLEIYRGYIHQSWRPAEKLILSGAFSLEHSDTAGTEPAYQAAVVAPLRPRHTLRASYAVSPTLSSLFAERSDAQYGPVTLVGNKDLDASRVTTYEVSHLGKFAGDSVSTEATLFYTQFAEIESLVTLASSFFPVYRSTLTYRNANDAVARGAEAKVRYRFGMGRAVYANYTVQTISDAKADRDVTDDTPRHKANVGFQARLWRGLAASADAGYKTGYRFNSAIGGVEHIPAYTRVDGRLSYTLREWEFFLAGENLTRPRHKEFPGAFYVPRVYFAGMTFKFGGK